MEETMKHVTLLGAAVALALFCGAAIADDDAKKARLERAGNCKDAKSQMEYFCDPSKAAADSMVAIGTACNNAKNNVKAACEGIDEADPEYKFK
jgi:hypothetical protein